MDFGLLQNGLILHRHGYLQALIFFVMIQSYKKLMKLNLFTNDNLHPFIQQ